MPAVIVIVHGAGVPAAVATCPAAVTLLGSVKAGGVPPVNSAHVAGYLELTPKYTADAADAESLVALQDALVPLLTRLLMPTTATADRMPIRTMAIRISMSVNPWSS